MRKEDKVIQIGNHVEPKGFGKLQAEAQGLENFGVGIGAGGEIAIGVLLLGNDGDVVDADIVQNPGDGHQAGAVQGGVNQLETGGLAQAGAHLTSLDGIVQAFLAVLAHILNKTLGKTILKGHDLGAGENVGFLNFGVDNGGGIVGHLTAIGAVGLVAVVLGGVVGCGHHDAGNAYSDKKGEVSAAQMSVEEYNAKIQEFLDNETALEGEAFGNNQDDITVSGCPDI